MFFRFAQISTCLLLLFSLFGCKTSPSAKLDFSDGSYEGEVNSKGEKDGTGIYRWIDGSIYDGDYSNDLRHGRGKFLWSNGESYDGEYLKDNRTGKGIYSWPDGSSYQGEFLSGNRHGKGRFQSADGTLYEGEWFDDLQHGQGTLHYTDGRQMKGVWRQGNLVAKPAVLPASSQKPQLPKVSLEKAIETKPPTVTITEHIEPIAEENPAQPEQLKTDDSSTAPPDLPNSSLTPDKPKNDPPSTGVLTNDSSLTPVSEAPEDIPVEVEEDSSADTSPGADSAQSDPDWTGTVAEAEAFFITELIDGIDTVRLRTNGIPFSGRMRIVNPSGLAQGEVNLLNGRMHGEEIFYDNSGEVVERNFWANGHPIGQ